MESYEIKTQAKAALRDHFANKMLLFIIPIIYEILTAGNSLRTQLDRQNYSTTYDFHQAILTLSVVFIAGIIGFVIGLFINIITVGAIFNYIKIFHKERVNPQFNNIFTPFSDGAWTKILFLSFIKGALTALLVISIIGIPFAIYLGLGWSQANYVLYDQLEEGSYLGTMNVLHASTLLMKGKRGDYFFSY